MVLVYLACWTLEPFSHPKLYSKSGLPTALILRVAVGVSLSFGPQMGLLHSLELNCGLGFQVLVGVPDLWWHVV